HDRCREPGTGDGRTGAIDVDRCVRSHSDHPATGEVDTEVQPADEDTAESDDNSDGRDGKPAQRETHQVGVGAPQPDPDPAVAGQPAGGGVVADPTPVGEPLAEDP